MTAGEFEVLQTRVNLLQQGLERQAQDWRKLRMVASCLAIFLALTALGFIVASVWLDSKSFPTAHQFTQIMGYQLLFTSLPLTLLAQALRTAPATLAPR